MKEFANLEEAEQWLHEQTLGDRMACDNWRAARLNDPVAMQEYELQVRKGCCGFIDEEVLINGEIWTIGCNFGH